MFQKIINMIETRKIISLVVVGVFAYLAVTGKMPMDNVVQVIMMVVTAYFLKGQNNDNNKL